MPELPEVENVARGLRPLEGFTLERLEIIDPRVWFESNLKPEAFTKQKLTQVSRRGKYLVLRFGGLSILQHLRMTGKMLDGDSSLIPEAIRKDPDGAKKFQIRSRFHFEGRPIVFFDPRRFGTLTAVDNEEDFFRAKGIAPDPIEQEALAQKVFLEKIRSISRAIKPALLDQTLAAGIGNIYADEVLHMVGLHPGTPAQKIKAPELIWLALQKVLRRSIESGGSSIIDYVNAAGERGTFSSQLLVYGRGGEPCVVCGKLVKKIVLGGRSTHFCLICQPKRRR